MQITIDGTPKELVELLVALQRTQDFKNNFREEIKEYWKEQIKKTMQDNK